MSFVALNAVKLEFHDCEYIYKCVLGAAMCFAKLFLYNSVECICVSTAPYKLNKERPYKPNLTN